MNTLEALRRKRSEFTGVSSPGQEELYRMALRNNCNMIYLAAFERVNQKAAYLLDRGNNPRVEPLIWDLSETFLAKEEELTASIDGEWLRDHPDMERFEKMVAEWEMLCMIELTAVLGKIGSQPG